MIHPVTNRNNGVNGIHLILHGIRLQGWMYDTSGRWPIVFIWPNKILAHISFYCMSSSSLSMNRFSLAEKVFSLQKCTWPATCISSLMMGLTVSIGLSWHYIYILDALLNYVYLKLHLKFKKGSHHSMQFQTSWLPTVVVVASNQCLNKT